VPLAQRALHGSHFEWRVSIDDENTLSVTWHFSRFRPSASLRAGDDPDLARPDQGRADGQVGHEHVMNQDFVAWLGQGAIADRTKEHLGTSDRGVIMIASDTSTTWTRWRAVKIRRRSCATPRSTAASICRSSTNTCYRRRPGGQYVNRVTAGGAQLHLPSRAARRRAPRLGRRDGLRTRGTHRRSPRAAVSYPSSIAHRTSTS